MIVRIVAAFCGGFALHGTERLIDATFNESNAHLAKYLVGGAGLLPFADSMHEHLVSTPERDRFVVAYVLAIASFGLGVLAGHWWDAMRKAD